jgi:hypothetical protein
MITITTPNAAKLTFNGGLIDNVFTRLEFNAPSNGKTIDVCFYAYESEEAYNNGDSFINVQGVEGFTTFAKSYDLSNGDDPETWKAQTIQVAHDEVKTYLEDLGYVATISGI